MRGFLGLTGYYRKFVQGYGVLAKPLTSLLKKGQFEWVEQAQRAFEALNEAMTQTLVLQHPDFHKLRAPKLLVLFLRGTQITAVQPLWMQEVIQSYEGDDCAQEAILECTLSPQNVSYFNYQNGILKYKGRIYVGNTGDLRERIVTMIHTSSFGGHSGIQNTYQRVSTTFLWPQLRQQVHKIVQECSTCQLNKHEHVKVHGMLQPLPIPEQARDNISMEFIEKLRNSKGNEVIWVVVDRLTKYGHFIALTYPILASGLAQVFIEIVYKLHGLPSYIISDRDPHFTSHFWKDLMKAIGVQHNLSTARHPQTDGQTERVNQCLESYLRCICGRFPKQWATWLPLAEWWYNTSYHSTIKATPFEALYGYKPPQ